MSKNGLLVVDVQNDYFPGGRWTLSNMEQASDNVARLIAAARAAGHPVFHVQHVMEEADSPFFTKGTAGAEIHPKVKPAAGEAQVVKNEVNAFLGTDLKAKLDAADVKDLVVCGAMSHMCVDAATRAASDFGYKVTLVHDACATRDAEFNGVKVPARDVHASFMAALGSYAKVVSTDDVITSTLKKA
jgi:nicotinamidase-related amidase